MTTLMPSSHSKILKLSADFQNLRDTPHDKKSKKIQILDITGWPSTIWYIATNIQILQNLLRSGNSSV